MSLVEAQKKIGRLNLDKIIADAAHSLDISKSELLEHVSEYRNFLITVAVSPRKKIVRPSKKADLIWHQHILHTKKYARDCKRIFGRFIHHRPQKYHDNLPDCDCG